MEHTTHRASTELKRDHLLHSLPLKLVSTSGSQDAEIFAIRHPGFPQSISLSSQYPMILITGGTRTGKSMLALELANCILDQTDRSICVVCPELGGPVTDENSNFAIEPDYTDRVVQFSCIEKLIESLSTGPKTKSCLILDDVIHRQSDLEILDHRGPMIVVVSDVRMPPFDNYPNLFESLSVWFSIHPYEQPEYYLEKLHAKSGTAFRSGIMGKYIKYHEEIVNSGRFQGCFIAITRMADAVHKLEMFKEKRNSA